MANGFSKWFGLILIGLSWQVSVAQNAVSVTDLVHDIKDLSQRSSKVYDQNGERCALIRFETPIPSFFTFNLGAQQIEKRENKDDEVWIWVSADVKKMTIRCSDCSPLKDYRVALKPGNVYRAKITTGLPQEVATTQNVNIYCEHTPFFVSIDGSEPVQNASHNYYTELPIGAHTLNVSAKLRKPYVTTIRVFRSRPYMDTIKLENNYGEILINASQSSYTLFVDGEQQKYNKHVKVEPGLHQLVITKERYERFETTVDVKLNEHDGTASIGGRVFGCNNLKGTPKGAVTVDVYGTSRKDGDGNVIATKPARIGDPDPTNDPKPTAYLTVTDTQVDNQTYELAGVFGGGNLAAYEPTGSSITTVNIHGCSTSSIKEVYGGGNAAPVPGCAVNIDGAYEIGYVYAGGNGTSGAANVGIKSDGNYGTGDATTYITGGTIYRTFAGSNANGDIRGTSTMNIADDSGEGACALKLGDVFSYGNRATMTGTSVMNMGCLQNKVGALYGGAMNANVNRSITLNINGGKFAKVFGGNKTGGVISGAIKVNVEQTVCDIEIDELYGCGNAAPYTTAYTDNETPANYADPEVNIISCKSIGAVAFKI